MPIFHLAINVTDLDETRDFYGDLLGCIEGRSTMFFCDPSSNPIAIKGFSDMSGIFAK